MLNPVTAANRLRMHANCAQSSFARQLSFLLAGRRLSERYSTDRFSMRVVLTAFGFLLTSLAMNAAQFSRQTQFESVEAFTKAANAFRPAQAPSDLAKLFTMAEPCQPEDPRTGKPVIAERLSSCETLWSDESQALVFATAEPKTSATPSAVGVLFLLSRTGRHWSIADLMRFTAIGKHAAVSAELTASVGIGYRLGSDGMEPVVTVRESQGGRGYGYQLSASFGVAADRLKRLELE